MMKMQWTKKNHRVVNGGDQASVSKVGVCMGEVIDNLLAIILLGCWWRGVMCGLWGGVGGKEDNDFVSSVEWVAG